MQRTVRRFAGAMFLYWMERCSYLGQSDICVLDRALFVWSDVRILDGAVFVSWTERCSYLGRSDVRILDEAMFYLGRSGVGILDGAMFVSWTERCSYLGRSDVRILDGAMFVSWMERCSYLGRSEAMFVSWILPYPIFSDPSRKLAEAPICPKTALKCAKLNSVPTKIGTNLFLFSFFSSG